jgi:hypothetical protein
VISGVTSQEAARLARNPRQANSRKHLKLQLSNQPTGKTKCVNVPTNKTVCVLPLVRLAPPAFTTQKQTAMN